MNEKLELAIQTILEALTTVWEDNGNIMAEAVRDSVILNTSKISGMTSEEIEKKIEKMVEDAQ
jgi:hypothetical protein